MEGQGARAVFRTPMKGLRILIGIVCGAFGAVSFFSFSLAPRTGLLALFIGAVLVLAGLASVFLERVYGVDPETKSFFSSWFFMNFRITRIAGVSLAGADAVCLAVVEAWEIPFFPDHRRVWKANKAFPVWITKEGKALAHVIGWKQPAELESGRGGWDHNMINSAWFPEYARYVAATCSKVLELPLVDQVHGKTVLPGQIPEEWLDKSQVKFQMKWEPVWE